MVRCEGCGYLALRLKESPELFEADADVRESGSVPTFPVESSNKFFPHSFSSHFHNAPRCYARAADLAGEYGAEDSDNYFLAVIRRDRDCPKFVEWRQGYSPREHQEMHFSEAAEVRRVAHEREQQLRLEAQDRRRDQESRRHNWLTLIVAMIGVAVSVWSVVRSSSPIIHVAPSPAPAPTVIIQAAPTATAR